MPKTLAPTPVVTEAETRTEQNSARKAVPVTTSESTIEARGGDIPQTVAHAPQPKPATYTAPISSVPSTKPTTRVSTTQEPNPDYAAWVKRQNVPNSMGANVKESHGAVGNLPAETVQAQPTLNDPAPPMTVPVTRAQRIAVVQPNAPGGVTLQQAVHGSDIPTIDTTRHNSAAQAANNAAVQAASNASVAKQVQIASGKTVPVGTVGTAQGGRYQYQVQPDGSVKKLTTGATSAPAPNPGGGGNSVGTHWDASSGSWQGGGQ